MGYESALAMFGGLAVATLAWLALNSREGKLIKQGEICENVAGVSKSYLRVASPSGSLP